MNEYFAQSLAEVLEETSTNMGNAMVLDHLSKKGSVTLEEAEFYHNLCTDVITESAEDFIPDTLEVPEAPEESAPIELFDAVGNKYVFDNGNLIPVEAEMGDELAPEMAPEMEPEMAPEPEVAPAPAEEELPESLPEEEEEGQVPPQFQEAEEAPEGAEVVEEAEALDGETETLDGEVGEVVEEGTVVTEPESDLLEESDNVVARILANLKV